MKMIVVVVVVGDNCDRSERSAPVYIPRVSEIVARLAPAWGGDDGEFRAARGRECARAQRGHRVGPRTVSPSSGEGDATRNDVLC